MGKFDIFKIDLKGMSENEAHYEFHLDNKFFSDIDASEDIRRGKLQVVLDVKRTSGAFELKFHTEGIVWIPCDRCLDDMEQPINTDDVLYVKLGHDYAEEDNDLIVIPEDDGYINIAWFIYEFITLNIPMKHVHPFGKCNKGMSSKLQEHICIASDDVDLDFDDDSFSVEEEKEIDPRWNELKKLLDNN